MVIRKKQLNKVTNYVIFMITFFLQAFIDGYYIAHGSEPFILKLLKYSMFTLGIGWGMIQLTRKKHNIFLRETVSILFANTCFLIISLFLILFRDGDFGFGIELLIRYSLPVLYAYVLLNLLNFEDIYWLMEYLLVVSTIGWFLEKGDSIFNLSNYAVISFSNSYSPFESHYFAPAAINCCAFFSYYREKRWNRILSFVLVLLTFKRPQIIFSICFLFLPNFLDPNIRINKKIRNIGCIAVIIITVMYYLMLQPENEWIIQKITGQTARDFTSGRSSVLQRLIGYGYKAGGLGTSENILGRGIEMDLISIMVEMTPLALIVFVVCYTSISGEKLYSVLVMAYLMLFLLTGSGLYNVFLWTPAFLFFGTVNYLKTSKCSIRKIIWPHIKLERENDR